MPRIKRRPYTHISAKSMVATGKTSALALSSRAPLAFTLPRSGVFPQWASRRSTPLRCLASNLRLPASLPISSLGTFFNETPVFPRAEQSLAELVPKRELGNQRKPHLVATDGQQAAPDRPEPRPAAASCLAWGITRRENGACPREIIARRQSCWRDGAGRAATAAVAPSRAPRPSGTGVPSVREIASGSASGTGKMPVPPSIRPHAIRIVSPPSMVTVSPVM